MQEEQLRQLLNTTGGGVEDSALKEQLSGALSENSQVRLLGVQARHTHRNERIVLANLECRRAAQEGAGGNANASRRECRVPLDLDGAGGRTHGAVAARDSQLRGE